MIDEREDIRLIQALRSELYVGIRVRLIAIANNGGRANKHRGNGAEHDKSRTVGCDRFHKRFLLNDERA